MNKLFLLAFLFSIALFSPTTIFAAGEFAVSYDVTYTIDEKGQTSVSQDIDLTNQTNRFYAKEYTLFISSHKVTDVKARDAIGALEITTQEKEGGTEIRVEFNEKVVGRNQTLSWNLSYDIPDLATKQGNVWEVIIPGVSEQENIETYDLTLYVPTAFGHPSFLSPSPREDEGQLQPRTGYQTYTFSKSDVLKSGVTAVFGDHQRYAFTLTYHLKNPNVVPIFTEITLPPDTDFQTVTVQSIDPLPEDVFVDEDGNTIATYQLTSGQAIEATAQGVVEVFAERKQTGKTLSPAERQKYTHAQRYWEVESSEIVTRARELAEPREIYDFVRQYLQYDYDRAAQKSIDRQGALQALRNPNAAVCMEFTDLFIALARAAGIPAREINGYAHTTDRQYRPLSLRATTDILHAWPEYWDEDTGWTPVDPTWAATTDGIDYFSNFDLNHVTLAIHGSSSHLPFPAGSFKYEDNQGPDLQFSVDEDEPIAPFSTVELSLDVPNEFPAGFPTKGKVTVRNIGNIATSAGTVSVRTASLRTLGPSTFALGTLPAYANRVFTVTFFPQGWWISRDEDIVVVLDNMEVRERVKIRPVSALTFIPWIIGIGGGLLILGTSYVAVRFIRKRRLKTTIAQPAPSASSRARGLFVQKPSWLRYLRWKGRSSR